MGSAVSSDVKEISVSIERLIPDPLMILTVIPWKKVFGEPLPPPDEIETSPNASGMYYAVLHVIERERDWFASELPEYVEDENFSVELAPPNGPVFCGYPLCTCNLSEIKKGGGYLYIPEEFIRVRGLPYKRGLS